MLPNGLPCPNPACTHVFPPDAVKGAAALTCPRCGTAYRFRKAPPPPPPPPGKSRPRVPPPPPPYPLPPDAPDDLAFDSPDGVVAPPRRRRGDGRRLFVGCSLFLLLAGGVGGAVWWWELWQLWPAASRPRSKLPPGWSSDSSLRDRLGASQAMSRQGPPGSMALLLRDYGTRNATDPELLREVRKFLDTNFAQPQYAEPTGRPAGDDAPKLGGVPALAFPFEGIDKDSKIPCKGHIVAVSHRGYAYWLYTWGPEAHQVELADDFDQLRDGVALRTDRDGWRPTPRAADLFTGPKLPYQLRYAREVWTREPTPKEGDPDDRPDLVLQGAETSIDGKGLKVRGGPDRMAAARVYSWPKATTAEAAGTDALARVRRLVKGEDDQATVDVLSKEVGKVGALPGQLIRLSIKAGGDPDRYALVAVAPLSAGTVAIYCECKWPARDSWQAESSLELVGSLRQGKAEK